MNKKRILLGALALALVVFTSCSNGNNNADAYGTIEADDYLVSAEVSGKLSKVFVDEGYKVANEQVIAIVDTVPLVIKRLQLYAQVDAVKAKKQGIEAQLKVSDEQLETIKTEYNRVKALFLDSAATQRQMDDIDGKYKVAIRQREAVSIQLNAVNAERESVVAQIAALNDQISRCTVNCPTSGTVTTRYAKTGEMVMAGKPVCRVANLDTVYARVYIGEPQLASFKIGNRVFVSADTDSNQSLKGEGVVTWVSSEAEFTPKVIQTKDERVNLVYAVKVRIGNSEGKCKVGMPVEVRLIK